MDASAFSHGLPGMGIAVAILLLIGALLGGGIVGAFWFFS